MAPDSRTAETVGVALGLRSFSFALGCLSFIGWDETFGCVERLREREAQLTAEEVQYISSFSAAEAIEALRSREDDEGRALVGMEGAVPHEGRAGYLKLNIPPGHVFDPERTLRSEYSVIEPRFD